MSEQGHDRIDELLLQRATEGLDAAESAELEWRLARVQLSDPEGLDEAAAWYWLGADGDEAPMPVDVAARAEAALSGEAPEPPPVAPHAGGARGAAQWRARWAWLAAAAAIVLAVAGWWPQSRPDQAPHDLAEARDELLANAPDAVRVEWDNTDHPRGQQLEGGSVVWSDARQEGYLTFRGMPPNDPDAHQYQLWVFDAGRSQDYPVDGGVFNARNGDEVVVPIDNKLPVEHATMFAVTLEPPGGVVISDRDPVLWIARAEQQASG